MTGERESSTQAAADAIRAGDRAAIARAITRIEKGEAASLLLGSAGAGPRAGYRIGITGPPGAGKSTLTNQLIRGFRAAHAKVAVLAVDPSSPYTQGALLGDRLRMNDIAGDPDVFIRSLATRGALGGLSAAAADAAVLLDAAGFDYVLIETVGVGQSEFDVIEVSDTIIVVLTPESGDEVQVAKAGLMEIADLFVLNKDDRPGSDAFHAALLAMLEQQRKSRPAERWAPPIVRTVAAEGKGADSLLEAIGRHRRFLEQGGAIAQRRRDRLRKRVLQLVNGIVAGRLWTAARLDALERRLDASAGTGISAQAIARELADEFLEPA
jgi:LAO/AO transport system kinase